MAKLTPYRVKELAYPTHMDSVGRITQTFVTAVAKLWAEQGGSGYFDRLLKDHPKAYRQLITRFVIPHLQRGAIGELDTRHNYPPFARLQEDFMTSLADHFVRRGHELLEREIDTDPTLLLQLMEALSTIAERQIEPETTTITGRVVDIHGAIARLTRQE